MSHNRRLGWLAYHGFEAEDWGADIESMGRSVLVKGMRQGLQEEFWLAANDGRALIHNESSKAKTWEELQAWIQEQPEAKKPLAAERNLFGDDE